VLIGMMGTGKTTVGRMLATRLGWAFWDNDDALQKATGQTAAAVQEARGQRGLHVIENRLLREALAEPADTVYAAAASVVLSPGLLTDATTVWLRASEAWEEQNIARSGQHHRPLPADAAAVLKRLNKMRTPLYQRVANVRVDVAGDPAATCDQVIAALGDRIRLD